MIEYFSNSVPVGVHCLDTPDLCIFDLETLKLAAVPPAKYFAGGTLYSLELWKPSVGVWQVYADEIGPDETILIETPYEIGLRARFSMVYEHSTLHSEEVAVTRFCCEGKLPPSTPDAPELARDCSGPSVAVTSPEFSDVEDAETETIELQRSSDGGDTWAHVHTFESEGTWTDESVVASGEYSYRARACNDSGCSSWSAPAAIDLISDTLTLTWLSPAAGSQLRGYTVFKFAVEDSDGEYQGVQLRINGALVQPSPQKHDDLYTLTYDTRNAGQGAALATIEAVGSDGCIKRASLPLTFANTRHDGVLYRDFLTRTARAGHVISKLRAQIALGEISANPSHRFWGQLAVTTDLSVPIVTLLTDPEVAQKQFDEMRPVPMETWKRWPQLGQNEAGRIVRGGGLIPGNSTSAKLRVRQERAEWFLAYDTQSEAVTKIRTLEPGKYFILTHNPDKVLRYDGEQLTELLDSTQREDIGGILDAAIARDKIYLITENRQLIAYDIEPLTGTRNRTLQMIIQREGRAVRFVEGFGKRASVVLVDATRETEQTLCVSLEGDQMLDAWTLDAVATLAWSAGGVAADLYIACGDDLYVSALGTGAPQFLGNFAYEITAICPTGVGLADGSVWSYDPKSSTWTEGVLGSGTDPISAIAGWWGSLEFPNLLWGKSTEKVLYGQDESGGYTVTHALDALDGVPVDGVSALGRYFVTENQDGEATEENTPADPDSKNVSSQVKGDERMLIGTHGGYLLALMLSRKTNASAWLHTAITSINIAEIVKKKKED